MKSKNDFNKETIEDKPITSSIWRYALPPFIAVFLGELFINFFVGFSPKHAILQNDAIEAIILIILIFFPIYIFTIRPLLSELKDHKNIIEKFKILSLRDSLTGLYSRHFYNDELSRLKQGRHLPISIIYIDIDGLNRVNNTLGHAQGDKLLIDASRILKNATRADDTVSRIGGDEFVILLPETDSPTAAQIQERIKTSLIEHNKVSQHKPISFSMGAATAHKIEQLDKSIHLADKNMYSEKKAKKEKADKVDPI